MVKVVYLLSTLKRSGPVVVLFNVVKILDRRQIEPIIITLSPEPENSMMQQFESLNLQIERLNLSRFQGMLSAGSKVEKMLKEMNPQIIHSHGFRSDSILARSRNSAVKVTTIHNNPSVDYPLKFGYIRGSIMANLSLKSYKQIDMPISCSKSIQKELSLMGVKTGCVQNGIDTKLFKPVPDQSRNEIRTRLNLPIDKLIFIVTGSLIKRKSVDTILKALSISGRQDILILVIGDGPERDVLEAILVSDNRILFLGFKDNINEYLNCADSIISASTSEGLPNGILEAMASGLHCILSDIPSHRELSIADNCCFFEIGNSAKIASIIDNLTLDRIRSAGEQNRGIACKLFSSEKMAREYQNIYLSHVK